MSNKGEFIYSAHLWGGLVGNHQVTNHTQKNIPNRVPENKRKVSDHLWDHENPESKIRKLSLDESLPSVPSFSPFESLI